MRPVVTSNVYAVSAIAPWPRSRSSATETLMVSPFGFTAATTPRDSKVRLTSGIDYQVSNARWTIAAAFGCSCATR